VPECPPDLDDRVQLVWKAAVWVQLGKIDPALGLLETLGGPFLDEWSANVIRGTRQLRVAEAQLALAVERALHHHIDDAAVHWASASVACADALGSAALGLAHRSGSIVVALPDPWLHVVDAFQERLDRERRRHLPDATAGGPSSAVLQFTPRGA
jgi:hypothetical protein